jgi:hypothetical protein
MLDVIIPALVTLFDTATTAQVYDGAQPIFPADDDFVLVGSRSDLAPPGAGVEEAAEADREWSELGNRWVNESGRVWCSAWANAGETDIPAVRLRVLATYEACEAALRADATLGGVITGPGLAIVSDYALGYVQTTAGAAVRVVFAVSYQSSLIN